MSLGRAIRAGAAYVELTVNDSKMLKGLKAAQARLQSFGAGLRSLGGLLSGFGLTAAAGFAYPVKAASDLEETMNKFKVVFGDREAEAKKWGDTFAKEVGRSKRQVADFLGGFQDLFVPLGFEPGAAEEMSKAVTRLSVDLASFNNMEDGDTVRDLQAALTGSGEVMKKYGVVLSEAAVKQELLNMKMDPKRATNQQKVMARMNIIMRGTTAAQGDATRSAGSFANQMKALKGQAEDTAASIGSALLPVITPLVGQLREVAEKVAEWAKNNPELLAGILKGVAIVTGLGVALFIAGGAASAVSAIFGLLAGVVTGVTTVLSAMGAVLAFLVSPIGLITAAVVGLGAVLLTSTGAGGAALDWLRGKFGGLMDQALVVFNAIRDALSSGDFELAAKILWLSLKLAWAQGIAFLRRAWSGFKTAFLKIATEAWYGAAILLNNAWALMEKGWVETTAFFSKMWHKFVGFVLKSWNTISGAIKKAWAKVKATVKGTDASAEIRRIENETKRQANAIQNETTNKLNEVEAGRRQRRAQIDRTQQGANAELVNTADRINAQRKKAEDAKLKAAEDDVKKARAELAASISEVDKAAGGGDEGDDGPEGPATPADLQKALDSIGGGTAAAEKAAQANTGATLGTDEGTKAIFEALRFGGNDPAEMTAENTKKMASDMRKLRTEAKETNAKLDKAQVVKDVKV